MEEEFTEKKSTSITEPQRQCLLHILRNCQQSVDTRVDMIENPYSNLCPADLVDILQNSSERISRVLAAARRGTFCAIPASECKFVSYFVGCAGKPVKGNRQKDNSLNILDD